MKDANVIRLVAPGSGRVVHIKAESATNLELGFDLDSATVTKAGADLVFSFGNNGQLVLVNFVELAQDAQAPDFVLPDGVEVSGDALLASMGDGVLETAAGAALTGGGSTYSDDMGQLLDGFDSLRFSATQEFAESARVPRDGAGVSNAGNEQAGDTPNPNPGPDPDPNPGPGPDPDPEPGPGPGPEEPDPNTPPSLGFERGDSLYGDNIILNSEFAGTVNTGGTVAAWFTDAHTQFLPNGNENILLNSGMTNISQRVYRAANNDDGTPREYMLEFRLQGVAGDSVEVYWDVDGEKQLLGVAVIGASGQWEDFSFPAPGASLSIGGILTFSYSGAGSVLLDDAYMRSEIIASDDTTFLVREDAAAGTLVADANGSDPDAGDTLSYYFVNGAGAHVLTLGGFSIDAATGKITVAGALAQGGHSLIVGVVDSHGASAERTITVDVLEGRNTTMFAVNDAETSFPIYGGGPNPEGHYSDGTFQHDEGSVTISGHGTAVAADGDWDELKSVKADASRDADVTVDNFVRADVRLGASAHDGGDEGSTVVLNNTKRGSVNTGEDNDVITVNAYSNGGHDGWDNTFIINSGEGDDRITLQDSSNAPGQHVTGMTEYVVNAGDGDDVVNVSGAYGAASVAGGAGNDTITVQSSNPSASVTVDGGEGRDTITVGNGRNQSFDSITVNAGADDDTVEVRGAYTTATVSGGAGNDDLNVRGTNAAAERIVNGGDGNDDILLEGTYATGDVQGGEGDDVLFVQGAYDSVDVDGGTGNDTITVRGGNAGSAVTVDGGEGGDTISVEGQHNTVVVDGGGSEKNTIILNGEYASGSVTAGSGGDRIVMRGDDVDATNTVTGGTGNDDILVEDRYNHAEVHAGAGDDTILVQGSTYQTAEVDGGSGDDTITVKGNDSAPVLTVNGGEGDDSITLSGTYTSSTVDGGDGNDVITAGAGADVITGGAGDDTIDGGAGTDTAVYSGSWTDYTVTKHTDAQGEFYTVVDNRAGSPDGTDTVRNVENIRFLTDDVEVPVDRLVNSITYTVDDQETSFPDYSDEVSVSQDGSYTHRQGDSFTVSEHGSHVEAAGNWNSLKSVQATSDQDGTVVVDNFVRADVTLGGGASDGDGIGSTVELNHTKRGSVTTGGDDDTITINAYSNEQSWDNTFHVNTGAGDDTITLQDSAGSKGYTRYVVDAGDGDDTIHVTGSHRGTTISGGEGNDTITVGGKYVAATVDGGEGDDTIVTGAGADTISGGKGNDTITAGAGDDVITGGAGDDIIDGGDGTDTAVYSGARDDYMISRNEDGSYTVQDLRAGSPDGTDTVRNVENFRFGAGAAETVLGADSLFNTVTYTVDDAEVANPVYSAENALTENRTYAFRDGSVSVLNGGSEAVADGRWNTIKSVKAETQSGEDADVTVKNFVRADVTLGAAAGTDGDTDGSSVTLDTVKRGSVTTGADDDSVTIKAYSNDSGPGTGMPDTFVVDTGAGNDTVVLQDADAPFREGNTEYTVRTGDGDDTVSASGKYYTANVAAGDGNDTITLEGSYAGARNTVDGGAGNDTITVGGTYDTATVTGGGDGSGGGAGHNVITVGGAYNASTVTAGDGGDSITTGIGSDTIAGGTGADSIRAGAGDDIVNAGAGDDVITGGAGDDMLDGGDGTDAAVYSGTQDQYTVTMSTDELGEYYTVVDNRDGSPEGTDILRNIENIRFGGESGADVSLASLASPSGEGVSVDMDGDVTTRVKDADQAVIRVGMPPFHDTGSDGSTVTLDTVAQGRVMTGEDNDTVILLGESSATEINTGAGDDTILGGAGVETVVYAGNQSDYLVTRVTGAGGEPYYTVLDTRNGEAKADTLKNVEFLRFADGTLELAAVTASADGMTLSDGTGITLDGGTGADTVTLNNWKSGVVVNSGAGDDTIVVAGMNSGTIYAGSGDDTVSVNGDLNGRIDAGSGNDSIEAGGLRAGSLLYGGSGNDAITVRNYLNGDVDGGSGDDTITVQGLNSGSSLHGGSGDDLIHVVGSLNAAVYGDDGNDTITIGDSLNANGHVYGGAGDDTITVSGYVNALVNGGEGNDHITIKGLNGPGVLHGGAGDDTILVHEHVDSTIDAGTGNDSITVEGYLNGEGKLYGGDGDDTIHVKSAYVDGSIYGGDGDDTITIDHALQGSGTTIDGGDGHDTLILHNYSAGDIPSVTDGAFSIGGKTVQGVETIVFKDGHSYTVGEHALLQDGLLTGTDGVDDTFHVTDTESGTTYISGFNAAEGDALNLHDLLPDASADSLGDYLSVTSRGGDAQIDVTVPATGGAEGHHTIILSGISEDTVNDLLANGKIMTDIS